MKSRTHYSVLNSTTSAAVYIIKLLIGFVSRTFFIKYLGSEYLGLNGLFTNILSFLSLAELGIGTTIVYELYKPLATRNIKEINAFMGLYKKAYDIIGIAIGVLGMGVIPFLPIIVGRNVTIHNIPLLYVLFLANSVVSYFFTYKRSILNADQQNYKVTLNDFVFYVIVSIIQIVLLIYTSNFILYLIVQIIFTFISNISISIIANKQYPFLSESGSYKLPKSRVKELAKNVFGNLSSQIGAIVVLGSDNILISMFVGLSAVGLYSNYTLITNAVKSLLQQVTNSITSSIGNLLTDSNEERHYNIFNLYLFINSSLVFLVYVGLFGMLNPFITIWLGKKYLFPEYTVMLIVFSIATLNYQSTVRNFSSAYGLFWEQRWKPLFEALLNILFSLFFLMVMKLQINGVLLGTTFSTLLVDFWYEPFIVFKYGFRRSSKQYFTRTIIFYAKFIVAIIAIHYLNSFLIVTNLRSFIVYLFVFSITLLLIYLVLFGTTKEFPIILKKLLKKKS